MEEYEALWAFGIILSFFTIAPPWFHYQKARRLESSFSPPLGGLELPTLTVLLPVRNESILILGKLDEILGADYPMSKISILVVDSGSTDGTAEIARNHLIENARGIEWRVESVDLPGKSIAVNTALDIINTEIFAMLDADAVLQPDALKLLVRWFQDSDIGGVCGRLDASKGTPDFSYRSRFNTLRIGESLMGSTPIFEGSVCAFRMSSIGSAKISPNINADDSQLAMLVRRNGFRAIMDPELRFTEPDSTNRNQRRRSVRRAQGLVRALLANRDLATFKRGQGRIHAHALFFHVMMPWTLLLSFSSLLASFIVDPFPSLGVGAKTHLISVAILLVVILSKTGRGFLRGASVLLESHVLMLLGVRLNVWETDRE